MCRLCLGVVKGRRAQGQPRRGRVQRRPRLPARASAPAPCVVHGKADDPLTPGLLDNLVARSATSARLFRFLTLAVVGEASKATTAMAAVAHPCSREEQP
jgi:hypothetical protein